MIVVDASVAVKWLPETILAGPPLGSFGPWAAPVCSRISE
jgi:hypothetical protein